MYEQLVRTYGRRMLSVARRFFPQAADAHDCVQEAFLQAFRRLETFEERSSLGTWLHRIVVNAALMKIRARTRRREEPLDDLMPEFDAQGCRLDQNLGPLRSVEEIVATRESQEVVRRAIEKLPEKYRTVLVLRDLEGYNIEETATILEMPGGTVKTRLHRARAALKRLLEPLIYGGGE